MHASIVSMHLATRGNNKILRTPPPHISSSEERLSRLTRCTLAQLRTSKSPFLKSYLHKVHAKIHPSPLCPLCNIHTHDTHHLFNCTHMRTTLSLLDLWTDPAAVTALLARWTEKLAGRPQAGSSDSPTSKGHGSGWTTITSSFISSLIVDGVLGNVNIAMHFQDNVHTLFTSVQSLDVNLSLIRDIIICREKCLYRDVVDSHLH